jgi:hypothetical protein
MRSGFAGLMPVVECNPSAEAYGSASMLAAMVAAVT